MSDGGLVTALRIEPGMEVCENVAVAHWRQYDDGELRLCLAPHPCEKISALTLLLGMGEEFAVTLETAESGEFAAAGPHPRVGIHINPGSEYAHGPCLTVNACVVCAQELWGMLYSSRTYTLAVHLEDVDQQRIAELAATGRESEIQIRYPGYNGRGQLVRPFTPVRPDMAIAATTLAASRYRPGVD